MKSTRYQRTMRTAEDQAYADRVRRNKKIASDRARTKRQTAERRAIRALNAAPIF